MPSRPIQHLREESLRDSILNDGFESSPDQSINPRISSCEFACEYDYQVIFRHNIQGLSSIAKQGNIFEPD